MRFHMILAVVLLAAVGHTSAECKDRRGDCHNMGIYCKLPSYADWMKDWCPKFCNLCGTTVTTQRPPQTHSSTQTNQPPRSTNTPPSGDCGKPEINQGRVIGGTTAQYGAWPWQILMLNNGRASCGGSIVSPYWIVTAAHCVEGKQSYQLKVRVGDHNRNSREQDETDIQVIEIVKHPSWNRRAMNADIAMLKLQDAIKFTKYVKPVCIPQTAATEGTECYITGWGKTSHPGSMTSVLQQAKMRVVSRQVCYNFNQKKIPIQVTDYMLCAGSGGSSKISGCHGDSGGPFVCRIGGRWELHGAVSYGSSKCSSRESYTVFAKVARFSSWITSNIRK